jgi:hypothetical protein
MKQETPKLGTKEFNDSAMEMFGGKPKQLTDLEIAIKLEEIEREETKQQTAVEWIIEEINQQQKKYIDLAKKDKSLKKGVDAILTATTLLKMKCEQAIEMEKQQQNELAIGFAEWCLKIRFEPIENVSVEKLLEIYKKDNL